MCIDMLINNSLNHKTKPKCLKTLFKKVDSDVSVHFTWRCVKLVPQGVVQKRFIIFPARQLQDGIDVNANLMKIEYYVE